MNPVRPTSGRLLQTLFNLLGGYCCGPFLDLFSGTGRVALEAGRRGFNPVVAVENNRSACRDLRDRHRIKAEPFELEILCMDVRRALSLLLNHGRSFRVIFADPPYENGWVQELAAGSCVFWMKLLSDDGVFVLEHSSRENLPDFVRDPAWMTRQYGDSCLSIYRTGSRREAK
jgi:16S rRNA (guanine(966)-N(2))-methyltransferase RsmD